MKASPIIATILLLFLGLAMQPVPAADACDLTSHPDVDPCTSCPEGYCAVGNCGENPTHESDECCDSGCQHCNLPCCSGKIMIPSATPRPDSAPADSGLLNAAAARGFWVDPDPLFHPPRG